MTAASYEMVGVHAPVFVPSASTVLAASLRFGFAHDKSCRSIGNDLSVKPAALRPAAGRVNAAII